MKIRNIASILSIITIMSFSAHAQITGGSESGSMQSGNVYLVKEINCSVEFPFEAQEVMRNDQVGIIAIGKKQDSGGSSGANMNTPQYSMMASTKNGMVPFQVSGKTIKNYKVGKATIKIYEDAKPKMNQGCNAYMEVKSSTGSFLLSFIGNNLSCEQARESYTKFFATAKKDNIPLYQP